MAKGGSKKSTTSQERKLTIILLPWSKIKIVAKYFSMNYKKSAGKNNAIYKILKFPKEKSKITEKG